MEHTFRRNCERRGVELFWCLFLWLLGDTKHHPFKSEYFLSARNHNTGVAPITFYVFSSTILFIPSFFISLVPFILPWVQSLSDLEYFHDYSRLLLTAWASVLINMATHTSRRTCVGADGKVCSFLPNREKDPQPICFTCTQTSAATQMILVIFLLIGMLRCIMILMES